VNTKAELRVVPSQCSWLPAELHPHLPSPFISKSDQFRTQPENQQACLITLELTLHKAARRAGPRVTSEEQVERVKELKGRANERRLEGKRRASEVKASRASGRSRPD